MLKRRFKEPFGKAGLTVAILALVLAMVGGAYAAGGLNPVQKKQVTKIAKKYAGKPGKPGAPGATGPAGANGTNGKDGAEGPPGTNGKNGTNGKSVNVGTPSNTECAEGGATVEQEGTPASKKAICNGSPWTAGGTLPSEATETGAWGYTFITGEAEATQLVPISFSIPLSQELSGSQVHYVGAGETAPSGCTGGTVAEPKADPGNLCVYAAQLGGLEVLQVPPGAVTKPTGEIGAAGAAKSGAVLLFAPPVKQKFGQGTWAVTAE